MTNIAFILKQINRSSVNRVNVQTLSCTNSTLPHLRLQLQRQRIMDDKYVNLRSDPVVTKIKSIEFKSIFSKNLIDLISLFQKYNHDIRIAGGAVRDLLMENIPTDIDLATTATPSEMKEMFAKENIRTINTNGERHGTITPRINDKENFEVTTLRIDVLTDGRHAEVQFTTDWQLDAYRRDLTINSMFLDFDGTVYDYFNGYEDLMKRRVRFVGNPHIRIKEDYLRILRYFRFYGRIAKITCDHEQETLNAIKANISGLEKVSGERIWDEMKKIFLQNMRGELIKTFLECGATKYIGLPENLNFAEFQKITKNSISDNYPPLLAISYLCAFLKTTEEVYQLHQRLKLSAYERDLAIFLVRHKEETRNIDDILYYKQICFTATSNKNVIKEYVLELLNYNNKRKLFDELKMWTAPPFPINGQMLASLGCAKGKPIGRAMNKLKTIWSESNFQMSSDELLKELPTVLKELNEKYSGMMEKKPKID